MKHPLIKSMIDLCLASLKARERAMQARKTKRNFDKLTTRIKTLGFREMPSGEYEHAGELYQHETETDLYAGVQFEGKCQFTVYLVKGDNEPVFLTPGEFLKAKSVTDLRLSDLDFRL